MKFTLKSSEVAGLAIGILIVVLLWYGWYALIMPMLIP
jgi:tetrahydromethanopterin S-methyltransferase subunit F